MVIMEYEGRTERDAIKKASEDLGIESDKLKIEVISEKTKFFSFGNLVKIRDASPTDPPILDADDYGYQSLRRDIVNIYGGGWGDGGGGGFTMLRLYFSGSLDTCDN